MRVYNTKSTPPPLKQTKYFKPVGRQVCENNFPSGHVHGRLDSVRASSIKIRDLGGCVWVVSFDAAIETSLRVQFPKPRAINTAVSTAEDLYGCIL